MQRLLTTSFLFLCRVSIVILFLVMCLMVSDVGLRAITGRPIPGVTELVEISMMLMVFLALPYTVHHSLHIVVDLLDSFFGKRILTIQMIVANTVGCITFALFARQFLLLGERVQRYGDITAQLHLPMYYLYYGIAGLSGIVCIAYIAAIFSTIFGVEPEAIPSETEIA